MAALFARSAVSASRLSGSTDDRLPPGRGIDPFGVHEGFTTAMTDEARAAPRQADQPGVGSRTAGSVAWLMASRLMARGIDFITLVVLARTLSPADFGLISVDRKSVV